MIPELGVPEYHVQSVDIDAEPTPGTTVVGVVVSTIEIQNPERQDDPAGLVCEASIELELHLQKEVEDENFDNQFGSIEVDLLIFIPEEDDELAEYVSEWKEHGYEELDHKFIRHVESGILEDVLNPIGDLLSPSFRGIVPWMQLTPPDLAEPESE